MRLLICDDHALLLDALSMALTDTGHTVVAMAFDPDDSVAAAREHQPDACLLDVNFPDTTGLSAIARIHEVSPNTKVVILSDSITWGLVADAVALGAQGLVGKRKPVAFIIDTLEKACRGQLAVDPIVLQDIFRPRAQPEDPLRALWYLTDREWEVMRCITDELNAQQMAEQLCVRPSTALEDVQNLLTKLGMHSRIQATSLMSTHASVDTWSAHMRHLRG